MFARFDENPAMTLRVIKETKRYGRTHNVKTVYPLQTKFAGGIKSGRTDRRSQNYIPPTSSGDNKMDNSILLYRYVWNNLSDRMKSVKAGV